MRIGVFGGSFDPVHNGHLALTRCCQRDAALDEVWFTPTAVQPLKHHGPVASGAHRLAMLELAIDSEFGEPGRPRPRSWHICRLEIDRGGVSYTVDTLGAIHAERPADELYLLLGADAVGDVPHWKEPAEIFRLATPLVVHRAGQPPPDLSTFAEIGRVGTAHQIAETAADDGGRCPPYKPQAPRLIDMPAVDVSSTEIRRRVAAGEPIDDLVPASVAQYIASNRVYC